MRRHIRHFPDPFDVLTFPGLPNSTVTYGALKSLTRCWQHTAAAAAVQRSRQKEVELNLRQLAPRRPRCPTESDLETSADERRTSTPRQTHTRTWTIAQVQSQTQWRSNGVSKIQGPRAPDQKKTFNRFADFGL